MTTPNEFDPRGYPAAPGPGGYQPAGGGAAEPGNLWIRFAARLIDGLIVGIVINVVLFATGMFNNFWLPGLLTGLLYFAYFVGCEVGLGWTPGKKILGLEVHGPGGAPRPDVQQSAIRNSWTLLGVIPFIGGLLELGACIWIAVTINNSPTRQGKHDELAGGTQVIKV